MKSKETIQERIAFLENEIKCAQENQIRVMKRNAETILKHANNPTYVLQWIDSLMQEVKAETYRVPEMTSELHALKWLLEQEEEK